METTFKTTEAYISGAICGHTWMPAAMGGIPFRQNLRGHWGILGRFTEPVGFREAFDHVLMEKGGDFQDSRFTSDTRVVVIRRRMTAPGKYELHVWERELSALKGCADLVNTEVFAGDFMGEE